MHMSPAAGSSAIRGHAHAKPANFGSLNSAIARGDLSSAQSALASLSVATNSAAKAVVARANIDELRQALASNDLDAARTALMKVRAHDVTQPDQPSTA